MAERVEFRNRRGLRLAADHYPAPGGAVVVMANDMLTHKRWRGRYPRIAAAANEAGIAGFAFDYGGCGESDDDTLRPGTMIEDLHDAVGEVRRRGYRNVALWGHVMLSGLCLDARIDGLHTIVLSGGATGPVVVPLDDDERAQIAASGRIVCPSMDPAVRAEQVFDASMFDYLANADQAARLRALTCPVLIINGNHPDDHEELARLACNRRGESLLPPGSRIAVIDGARHHFADHLDELARIGVAWLAAHVCD